MTTAELHEILDDENRKLTVVVIYPYDNKLLVLAEYPTEKGGVE